MRIFGFVRMNSPDIKTHVVKKTRFVLLTHFTSNSFLWCSCSLTNGWIKYESIYPVSGGEHEHGRAAIEHISCRNQVTTGLEDIPKGRRNRKQVGGGGAWKGVKKAMLYGRFSYREIFKSGKVCDLNILVQ